jgi:hypothetical protein
LENNRGLGTGGLGTPAGDKNKYFFLKNGEFDYDQLFSAIDYSSQGWLPPNAAISTTLADGYDTRYLLSFGPFDIELGDSLPVTIGYIAGDKFHTKPGDFSFFNAGSPQAFADKLDFSDLATNSLWAGWVYDNPGLDTDNDGFKGTPIVSPCTGDTIYEAGDGVPDFKGPPPPPPPILHAFASPGRVVVRWNGKATETAKDPFSSIEDFEGYRVYLANKLQLNSFALLSSYDHDDYDRYSLNLSYAPPRWEQTEIPFSLDSLKSIYAVGDAHNPPRPNFNPDQYNNPSDSLIWNLSDGTKAYFYFVQQDYNRSTLDTTGTAIGTIRKTYPNRWKIPSILTMNMNM